MGHWDLVIIEECKNVHFDVFVMSSSTQPPKHLRTYLIPIGSSVYYMKRELAEGIWYLEHNRAFMQY